MADVKISELTELATAPAGTDIVAIVDDPGGSPVTKRVTVTNLLAGMPDATASSAGKATATQITKLDAIEAGADVTDAGNVTAAGALMDSEVDASLKTFSLPENTTISTYGKSLVGDAAAVNARATLDVDQAGTDNSTDVTVNANATAGGLTLSTQEINFRAATNALTGYATATHITAIEAAAVSGANSDITSLSGLTTPLTVAQGGTGAATLADGGVLLGSGTGAVTAMGVLADGEIIVGDGTTDPVAESGATARTSLGAAASGANSDITSMTGLDDDGIPAAKVAGGGGGKDMIEIQVFL